MKSAYELAMERFGDDEKPVKLTDGQKARLAEVDRRFDAKVAEKKLALGKFLDEARACANYVEIGQLEEQLTRELTKFGKQREEAKDKIRSEKA